MKPFRGKPEKPKRSNGEIHRQLLLLPCGFAMLRDFGSVARCHCGMSRVVGVHFSPSRTSRPVGCRPTARMVDCRDAFTRAYAADLRCSRPTARRYGTLQLVSSRTLRAFWLLGRLVPLGFTDLVAVAGCSMWPLSRGCPRTGSLERIPVGDATALGTFRTRLETRTKESNMCASHWDFFKRNLKAQ